jgi:hypothetical protein
MRSSYRDKMSVSNQKTDFFRRNLLPRSGIPFIAVNDAQAVKDHQQAAGWGNRSPSRHMKKKSKDETADELRPEYDLAPCSRKVRVGNMPSVASKQRTL